MLLHTSQYRIAYLSAGVSLRARQETEMQLTKRLGVWYHCHTFSRGASRHAGYTAWTAPTWV
jgi:hypothetical protein